MLLNSINYFIFLLIVFILNNSLPVKFRWILLLAASIFFYMLAGPVLIIVPVIITIVTYFCGIYVERTSVIREKKTYFLIGVIVNTGLLVFFKYINFLIENVFRAIHLIDRGHNNQAPIVLQIIVPLGISYITFQAIGYLIEIKRGNHNAEKNLGLFATYIMFFPKILSGPIERAHEFLPQLHQKPQFNYEQASNGLKRILWGLFLKLVVASRLALYTDAVFSSYQYHTGITLLIAAIFFPIQLYADLGGYTSMAIGSAQLLGYNLMENFDSPFIAKSVSEFWRRWHISLTTWVNEYIYTPIVIKWRSWNQWGVVTGVIVTFLILGFWHGASWNFIVFGFLQGLILSLEFLSRKIRKRIRKKIPEGINTIVSMAYTFGYFCFSSIFFFTDSIKQALSIIGKIFTFTAGKDIIVGDDPATIVYSFLAVLIMTVVSIVETVYKERISLFNNSNGFVRKFSYAFVVIIILLIGVFDGGQFIYFKF